MDVVSSFKGRFTFDPARALLVGFERECFLVDALGQIVPRAKDVLDVYSQSQGGQLRNGHVEPFGYELSACQLESRTDPVPLDSIWTELRRLDRRLELLLEMLKLTPSYTEVGPDDMPLDTYDDPDGRYRGIAASLGVERLRAACQVIGTHVHIGMPDHDTALRVYNEAINACEWLCKLGDSSSGRRLKKYSLVAPSAWPRSYKDWSDFYQAAVIEGFAKDPRNNWSLIRISPHGTIEFRTFGATSDLEKIIEWATHCCDLCSV